MAIIRKIRQIFPQEINLVAQLLLIEFHKQDIIGYISIFECLFINIIIE